MLTSLLLTLACAPAAPVPADTVPSDTVPADTAAPSAGSADSGAGSTAPLVDPVSDLNARLHETIGSLIVTSWTQREAAEQVSVEYSFDPGEWWSSPVAQGTEGAHEQILLGVPYGAEVTWRVVSAAGEQRLASEDQHIQAGPRPAALPQTDLEVSEAGLWADGRFLFTSVSTHDLYETSRAAFWLVIVDRRGRAVWSYELPDQSWTLFAKPARDGAALLWDESTFWSGFDGGQDGRVHRMTLDGYEERAWSTPGLDHSFDDLDPDTIAWSSQGGLDSVIYIRSGDGEAEALWSCRSWLAGVVVGDGAGGPVTNYCGANALNWLPSRDSFVLSLFTHEVVLELDHWTGEVIWYADPRGGNGFSVPDDAQWYWQHDASLISDDRLLLSSGVLAEGADPGEGVGNTQFEHTAVYEYALDREGGALTLAWSYQDADDWVSQYKGGASRLENGDTLHYYGDLAGVREISPAGQVLWSLRFTNGESPWIGRSTLIEDLYALLP